ncbi:MAG: aldolase catalytic domain-containing protein [Suilimivivens sp.]
MKNVRVLDCTLRDGGRIINCEFPDSEIKEITAQLARAKIDIIEVGFLRDCREVNYIGNSTFFTSVNQITPFLDKSHSNVIYTAFIDYGMFDFDNLEPYDGSSIDAIRLGFTKKNYDESKEDIIRCAKIIIEKGYKIFIQGVNSLSYTDRELLELVDMVNEIHPYSFGIVDTYGAMYVDDVDRLYGLIDHNMLADICINFHSHNNYQLSFAFAQEIIKLSSTGTRQIIVDGTLGGMGKVAGNLNTELIVDYLVRKKQYDYELDDIFDLLDDYIYKYSLKFKWGYSTSAMMAGIYKSHPNNVIYLTEKFRLESKDIGKLLSMIEPEKRQRYDYDNIEKLYVEYISEKVDDTESIEHLKNTIGNCEVVVLVPGQTLKTYRNSIDKYINKNKVFVISVNFVTDYEKAYSFFGNQKRYNHLEKERNGRNVIVSSNINAEQGDIVVNYHSLINRGYKYFENSTIMLLNLLKRIGVEKIAIAGFDGFENDGADNYSDASFQNDRHIVEFEVLNKEIEEMFANIVKSLEGKCAVKMITPSRFECVVKNKEEGRC